MVILIMKTTTQLKITNQNCIGIKNVGYVQNT